MSNESGWAADVAEVRRRLNRVSNALVDLAETAANTSPELRSGLATVWLEVKGAQTKATELSERLSSRPLGLLLMGQPLSSEEFYLLVACGVLQVKGGDDNPHEQFMMLRYEDEKRGCYINPDEMPWELGKSKIRLGPPPEEISWDKLRPEQRAFFEKRMPELAHRFRRPGSLA